MAAVHVAPFQNEYGGVGGVLEDVVGTVAVALLCLRSRYDGTYQNGEKNQMSHFFSYGMSCTMVCVGKSLSVASWPTSGAQTHLS